MEKEIQAWLKGICDVSQFRLEYWKARELDDPDGWGSLLAPSFQDGDSVSGSGILLTGGDSHSKISFAMQVLNLLKPEAYDGVFISGTDLGADGFAQTLKKLNSLFDYFNNKGMGLCLILDDLDEYAYRRNLLQFLGHKLCEYNMYGGELAPLFLLIMDEHEQDIPALLRDCLQLCRLQLPNKAKRSVYLEIHAKSLRNYLSLEVFAQATEGASYVQLLDMITLAENYIDSLDGRGISDDELKAFLADQMPNCTSDNPLNEINKSIQQMIEQLKNLPVGGGGGPYTPHKPIDPKPPLTNDNRVTREDIENMPPKQLATELFGEDRVKELLQPAVITQ